MSASFPEAFSEGVVINFQFGNLRRNKKRRLDWHCRILLNKKDVLHKNFNVIDCFWQI